jgi:hypothetical protein
MLIRGVTYPAPSYPASSVRSELCRRRCLLRLILQTRMTLHRFYPLRLVYLKRFHLLRVAVGDELSLDLVYACFGYAKDEYRPGVWYAGLTLVSCTPACHLERLDMPRPWRMFVPSHT